MNITVYPYPIGGRVTAPPSKSHVHRLLIAAALCQEQETAIHCVGENEDIAATVRCLSALNADIRKEDQGFRVYRDSSLHRFAANGSLDCGESGSTLRFLLPLCAAKPHDMEAPVVLTGAGRLPSRPNGPLLDALRSHGAQIHGDFLPLTVDGGLFAGDYELPGNVSSQYFSGLLFALPLLEGDSALRHTSPLESRPYVDLTLSVLRQFGVTIMEMENGWRIPGGQRYASPGAAEAEGDWSAAAFWLGANALGNAVTVEGLNDAEIMQVSEGISFELSVDYESIGKIKYNMVQFGVGDAEEEYTDGVTLKIRMKKADFEKFKTSVVDATSGKAKFENITDCEYREKADLNG